MNVPMADVELVAQAEWLVNETLKVLTEIRGIEYRVSLMDYMQVPPELITFGTADAWGYDGVQLALVDAKSGQERDYKEQMACYALALMDEQRENSCKCLVLYCDLRTRDTYTFTYQEAEVIVFDIIGRVNAGVEPPQENPYCSFCAKKPTCPVWVIPAAEALSIVEDKTFDLESLKADPIKLGEFWDRWTKARKLVEDAKLREAALAFLNIDKDSIPGWETQTCNGRESYDDEEIEEIIGLIPELGMDRARSFVSINREAFELAWKAFSKKPVPVIPSLHAGTYQKLIKSKK